jgi:hypothetical protein
MSIFSSIMNKIFHHNGAGASASPGSATQTGSAASSASSGSSGAAASAAPGGGSQTVDVEAVLSGMAAKKGQKFDWHHSIVDLMKLLDLDSSISARKELARELHYTGDTDDSAKMNVWLHKQVMQKLAENGGKAPDSMKA